MLNSHLSMVYIQYRRCFFTSPWIRKGKMFQTDLLDRLKRVMDTISENPKTLSEVSFLLEEFVASMEEIAYDLMTDSDGRVAENVRETAAILQKADNPSLGAA